MRRFTIIAVITSIAMAMSMPAKADNVGAVIGAISGTIIAGPVGFVGGLIIGGLYGRPFWGPHSPYACWIDERWHRHCPRLPLN